MAARNLAIPAGLEPATRGVEIRYSIQLSYGTVRAIPAGAGGCAVHRLVNMKNLRFRQGGSEPFSKALRPRQRMDRSDPDNVTLP